MRSLSAREIVQFWEWGQDRHPVDRALLLIGLAQPDVPPDQLAALTVGQRNAQLLTIRAQTLGNRLQGLAICPQCQTPLEFELNAADLRYPQPTAHEIDLHLDRFDVHFRLPDSYALAAIVGCDEVEAARLLLIEQCVVSATFDGQPIAASDLPNALIEPLAAAVLTHDPQSEMRFTLTCEACDHTWSALFDVVSFLWSELSALAKRLLQDVHVLARTYGWREADILAMSATRRQFYLELQGDG